MVSTKALALTSGAITGLKKNPVRLVKKKSEIIAKGANFAERQRGILKANLIQWFLHVSDGTMNNIGHLNYVPLQRNFCATHGGTDCKELEIETGDKMEILFQWLLFSDTIPAS
jgi:hypothetical protein